MANRIPEVWTATWEHVSICGLCFQWHHADLGELQCQLKSQRHLDLGCCLEPCLGLWFYCSLNLCWCLLYMLPQKITKIIRIWASTCVLLGSWALFSGPYRPEWHALSLGVKVSFEARDASRAISGCVSLLQQHLAWCPKTFSHWMSS